MDQRLSLFDLGLAGYPCLTIQTSGHKKELASQSRVARAPEKVRGVSTSVADISGIGASAIHPTSRCFGLSDMEMLLDSQRSSVKALLVRVKHLL